MTVERCDVLMGEDDLLTDNDDLVLGYGEAVIIQNMLHALIEDERIFDLIKAPTDKVAEILDHCISVIEQDEDAVQQTFSWKKDRNRVSFSGKLTSGATVNIPWTVEEDGN